MVVVGGHCPWVSHAHKCLAVFQPQEFKSLTALTWAISKIFVCVERRLSDQIPSPLKKKRSQTIEAMSPQNIRFFFCKLSHSRSSCLLFLHVLGGCGTWDVDAAMLILWLLLLLWGITCFLFLTQEFCVFWGISETFEG